MNQSLRLVLSLEQSVAIRESGIRFAVIHPGSWPDTNGRFLLELIECDQPTADAAVAVAQGRAIARRIKPPAPALDNRSSTPTQPLQ